MYAIRSYYALQTTELFACDTDGDGKEFFNLADCESLIVTNNNYTFSYYTTQTDAYNDTNAITRNNFV